MGKSLLNFSTKELALVSVFSSLWVVSQLYLGPTISQITQVHGVVQRILGWFLMFVLADLTGKFGRVTLMSAVSSLATRIIRLGRLYGLFMGLGYALGGFTFDLLFFILTPNSHRRHGRLLLLFVSSVSGAIAILPYLLFKLYILGFYGFLLWTPYYTYITAKGVVLSTAGAILGLSLSPRIKSLFPKL